MPTRLNIRRGGPARQRGYAMILVISLFALMASYFIASGLSRTGAEVNNNRDRITLQAMQAAKAALIAYAASQAWGTDGANDQPGALPCPAADDAGTASSSCLTDATRVGRLAWKTIGASELRDGSGQILWYALSANFRKASGTTVINSDTQGTLTVTGSTPASNAVAVIIAPGAALNEQDRSVNLVSNYLESTNATGTVNFVTKSAPDTWNNTTDREVVFNDNIAVITQADLMAVVEPAVAARIERDIKPELTSQLSDWGRLPFPALFNNASNVGPGTSATRTQDTYIGDATPTTEGLLPITSLVNSWSNFTLTKVGGTGNVVLSGPPTCAPVASVGYRCTFNITGAGFFTSISNLRVQMDVTADRAGLGFTYKPTVTSVATTLNSATNNFVSPSFTVSAMTSAGAAPITYVGTINTSCNFCSGTRTVRITFADLVTRPIISSTDTTNGWFIKNQWYRQTYYAVSAGFLPGGDASCTTTSPATCLTVNNWPTSNATAIDKSAILIFAGRALTGSRPSSSLTDYLEGENQSLTSVDRIFTNRTGTASSAVTLNDRAIVLSP